MFIPQTDYLALVQQCMNFACELMDLCRGTQEVEAVLGQENEVSCDPLARLRLAIQYNEKKVSYLSSLARIGLRHLCANFDGADFMLNKIKVIMDKKKFKRCAQK